MGERTVGERLATKGEPGQAEAMTLIGWNGEIGGAAWWARALTFAAALGVLLGLLGPFGSYLNDDASMRVAHFTAMSLLGVGTLGVIIPLAVRIGWRIGLPTLFSVVVAGALWALPLAAASALLARTWWPAETAGVRPIEWYGQSLLIGSCALILWYLIERIRIGQVGPTPQAPARDDRATPFSGEVLCLQMEDHFVRVHRPGGSTLELMTMQDAIARYGTAPGLQIHRSWWVAESAWRAAERDGRNWRLRLANGITAPVARNRVAAVRDRGWIVAD
jgi:hypothetical protein